jgi:hypothetical protein
MHTLYQSAEVAPEKRKSCQERRSERINSSEGEGGGERAEIQALLTHKAGPQDCGSHGWDPRTMALRSVGPKDWELRTLSTLNCLELQTETLFFSF